MRFDKTYAAVTAMLLVSTTAALAQTSPLQTEGTPGAA
jgi:hypothetical protein